ncbi:MAG TPA: winged helix-turn-helix domain-containing protein, partial [Aliiroseovarius sp.]|nr:winged helix-turn-helix domain-containing protein [Aliiroseovarius sp.]
MSALHLSNRQARHLWLAQNHLLAPPTGPLDLAGLVAALGFVQIDTIRNVVRAHDHIIWSRNLNFREGGLWPLLASR